MIKCCSCPGRQCAGGDAGSWLSRAAARRCEHDWLAACLVDCQQLVLKATLDSLQRGKASGIKRRAPSEDIPLLANHAHEEDAGHKPAPADAAPRGAYTKTTEQAPAPKRPATEAHVTYQDNGPQTAVSTRIPRRAAQDKLSSPSPSWAKSRLRLVGYQASYSGRTVAASVSHYALDNAGQQGSLQ